MGKEDSRRRIFRRCMREAGYGVHSEIVQKKEIRGKTALTMEELQNELDRFTGTEKYYRHFTGGKFTDGVKHLADRAEAHWLIDAIFSYQIKRKIRDLPFQIWTLKVLRSELGKSKSEPMAILEMKEDTDAPIQVSQKIPFTDFPEGEVKLYLIGGVLLLPSEY